MKTMYHLIAIVISVGVLAACGEKNRTTPDRLKRTDITVHDNPQGLSDLIRLPAPYRAVRWSVVPVVPTSRLDIGPSDYDLYVVVDFDSAQWPAWERALTAFPSPGNHFLMEEVAEKLLPPEWLASTASDSLDRGRLLSGTFYKPDSVASGVYLSGVAVRHGNHLFMNFYTM